MYLRKNEKTLKKISILEPAKPKARYESVNPASIIVEHSFMCLNLLLPGHAPPGGFRISGTSLYWYAPSNGTGSGQSKQ